MSLKYKYGLVKLAVILLLFTISRNLRSLYVFMGYIKRPVAYGLKAYLHEKMICTLLTQ